MLDRAALLLPPNRSALESAVVDALHTLEHPERLLSTLYNPDAIAAPLLPWLAWGRDVLAWPSDADETQRRQLTARSWHLHRRMGTLSGLRELAAVFGGTITKAITPPAKLFAAPALTVAERNAFVARYPQLRIELDVNNHPVSLVGERIDVAVRITDNPEPGMIARRLGECRSVLCASPALPS